MSSNIGVVGRGNEGAGVTGGCGGGGAEELVEESECSKCEVVSDWMHTFYVA